MYRITTRSMSTAMKEAVRVIHDSSNNAFRAMIRADEVGHLEYRIVAKNSRKQVDFNHTYTKPEAQGKGVAAAMVKAGLEWARQNSYGVIPSCSYVAAYIEKNPEWKSSL
jgi:predicted GNAT family acetyltransferase